MEGDEATKVGKVSEQSGKIAIAYENLGMRLDLLQVERFQKIIRAIASTRANDCLHILTRKHGFQFARPAFYRSREVKFLIEDRVQIKRPVAGAAQPFAPGFQIGALDVAGGRYNADRVPRSDGRRLEARC